MPGDVLIEIVIARPPEQVAGSNSAGCASRANRRRLLPRPDGPNIPRRGGGGMDFKLEGETYGKAVAVADGFWMIATRHRPGLSKQMFEINNRCLVFRLKDAGGPQVLLVANAVDPTQALD